MAKTWHELNYEAVQIMLNENLTPKEQRDRFNAKIKERDETKSLLEGIKEMVDQIIEEKKKSE
jgi:hypothetical protein